MNVEPEHPGTIDVVRHGPHAAAEARSENDPPKRRRDAGRV
jgi:hypothetical protein